MSASDYSVPDWCFFGAAGLEPAAYYNALRELGVDTIEMTPPERWDVARAAGMKILNGTAPGMQEGPNDRRRHATMLPLLRDAISRYSDAGIPNLVVFSGNRGGISHTDGIAACIDFYAQLMDHAEHADVTLHFEMLCDADHADYHAARTAFGVAVAHGVNHPRLKLVYDIYHLFRGGDDPELDIPAYLPYIGHLHTAEAHLRTVPVADGLIPWAPIIASANSAGYTGQWGLEFKPGPDPLAEIAAAIRLFEAGGI